MTGYQIWFTIFCCVLIGVLVFFATRLIYKDVVGNQRQLVVIKDELVQHHQLQAERKQKALLEALLKAQDEAEQARARLEVAAEKAERNHEALLEAQGEAEQARARQEGAAEREASRSVVLIYQHRSLLFNLITSFYAVQGLAMLQKGLLTIGDKPALVADQPLVQELVESLEECITEREELVTAIHAAVKGFKVEGIMDMSSLPEISKERAGELESRSLALLNKWAGIKL